MPKVIVTFEDLEGGGVDMRQEFVPPLKRDEEMTPAQRVAVEIVQAVVNGGELLEDWEEE